MDAGVLIILVLLLIGGLVIVLILQERRAARLQKQENMNAPVAMVLSEESHMSGLGVLCAVLLVLVNISGMVAVFAPLRDAPDIMVSALIWIALNQVLLAGIALCRRRRFVVRRRD